jgi:copper resistance protein D
VDETLIFWRALHFAATIQVVGVLIFCGYILRNQSPAYLGRLLRLIFWISLVLAFISGAAWFCTVAASIDDSSWTAAITDGTAATVLTDTQFGRAWLVRIVAGLLLAASAAITKKENIAGLTLQVALASVLVGGLALAGHAASTSGVHGDVHLAADILHLIAVSAWLGGLLPYALYLSDAGPNEPPGAIGAIQDVTRRFSNIGVAAVLMIAVTGIINTSNLVGSAELLTHNTYGQLLMIKVALFLAMVMVATVNRVSLAPRLSERNAIATMRRNALIETAFGLLILIIVAVLGTMPPALFDNAGIQH